MSDLIGLQMQFFLASILSGIILLAVYDIIRILRRIIKHNGIVVSIEDILFWIAGSIFIFVMMYKQNDGIIRGFSILGMLIGMLLYNHLLSKHIVKGVSKLINSIIKIIYTIIDRLLTPFRYIFRKIKGFFGFIFCKLMQILKKIFKYLVKQLKNTLKTVKISVTKK